jgi:hypothetical protein
MPSYYDIPLVGDANFQLDNFTQEDVNKFAKLPFYLTHNEVRRFPMYKVWDALYGTKKWQQNMGPIMRGVRPENSPIADSFVYPNYIQSTPRKNVYEILESQEDARIRLHRFESKQFNFLPNFQDFRDNQLKFPHDDLIRQIALYNERFIRGTIFHRAPAIMIAGNNGTDANIGTNELVDGCPATDLPENGAAPVGGKNAAWLAAVAGTVGQALTLKVINKATGCLDDDLGALPFEGTLNTPRDNDLVKGKYVLITGTEAWRQFMWDDSVGDLKAVSLDLLFDGFKGSLFGQVTTRAERFPLRMNMRGEFVAPQVIDLLTNKTRPNPRYTGMDAATDAVIEWAFLCGADAWNTITVGPPPKEFTSKKMDAKKFYSLKWNGEVQLTDQVLIRYPDGTYDLNKYGTQLQLISQAVFGALAAEVNNILPICFRRRRVATS